MTSENTMHHMTETKGFMLSRNPERAMEETIKHIETLQRVYEAETQALIDVDSKAFMQLQDEKLRAAQMYQNSIQEIISRKAEMVNVNPRLKDKLMAMQKDFQDMATVNKAALERMQRGVRRFGDTLRTAAKRIVNNRSAYGENGQMKENTKKRVSIGLSETA